MRRFAAKRAPIQSDVGRDDKHSADTDVVRMACDGGRAPFNFDFCAKGIALFSAAFRAMQCRTRRIEAVTKISSDADAIGGNIGCQQLCIGARKYGC